MLISRERQLEIAIAVQEAAEATDGEAIDELIAQGKNDSQIARAVHTTRYRIRQRRGLTY